MRSPDDTAGGRPGLRAVPGAESLSILNRTASDRVGGSGLWQHLQVPALPIADLAALVGATNDNLATNVLLRRVGLDGVRSATATNDGADTRLTLDLDGTPDAALRLATTHTVLAVDAERPDLESAVMSLYTQES